MNLIVLIVLSPKAIKIVKDYSTAIKEKKEPIFVPKEYDIDDYTGA